MFLVALADSLVKFPLLTFEVVQGAGVLAGMGRFNGQIEEDSQGGLQSTGGKPV